MKVQMKKCGKCGKYINVAVTEQCPFCDGKKGGYAGVTEPLYVENENNSFSGAQKTVPVSCINLGMDPIVGWLVSIVGESKGRDYRIRYGQNFIGRGTDNDICLSEDETVSRTNQARLICDKKSQQFYIVNGDGRASIYVNGKIVLSQQELFTNDILEIGRTQLIFIPLCGEKFSWENN